ncbi:hypothetical protein AAH979_42505, partial [Plantactinospora sp. ZYX-F-223]|uniref:hypothetical protein n=1 Tax=Plantactinospora sp. ZYX-F-223 TaxID=3144103 RepID=UPI0031FDE4E3
SPAGNLTLRHTSQQPRTCVWTAIDRQVTRAGIVVPLKQSSPRPQPEELVRRHTRDGQPIARLARFDAHDKLWSTPLPYLFHSTGHQQARHYPGHDRQHAAPSVRGHRRTPPRLPRFEDNPHDFRRIVFA